MGLISYLEAAKHDGTVSLLPLYIHIKNQF
jgi:hypothetical protein